MQRFLGCGASLVIGAAVVSQLPRSTERPPASGRSTVPDVVEAHRFVLRDSKDRTRAVLECAADGRPSLSLMDQNGDTKMSIGIDAAGMGEIAMFDGGTVVIVGPEDLTPFELSVIPEFGPELWLRSKAGFLRLSTGALDLEPHCIGQTRRQPTGPRVELLTNELDGLAAFYANKNGGCGLALGFQPGTEDSWWQIAPSSMPSSRPEADSRSTLGIGLDGNGKAGLQLR